MGMAEIEQLLKADEENAEKTRHLFLEFDPELLDTFDEGNHLFQSFMRSFSQESTDDVDQAAITAITEKLGLKELDLIAVLKEEKKYSCDLNLINDLNQIRARYYCRRARALLTLQAYRSFMFAATDIRRMHVVRAIGQLRPEIEAVALITVFQNDNQLAVEWYNIRANSEGKTFFKKTIGRVLNFCKTHALENEWNLSSAVAQHSRLIGLVDGLHVKQFVEGDRTVHEFKLALQDFSPEQRAAFITRALYILRTQAKLLLPIELALPEASDPLLRETRIPRFQRKIERLYKVFERKFPQFLAELGMDS